MIIAVDWDVKHQTKQTKPHRAKLKVLHQAFTLVKNAYQKNNFLISQPKHMLWLRRNFRVGTLNVNTLKGRVCEKVETLSRRKVDLCCVLLNPDTGVVIAV